MTARPARPRWPKSERRWKGIRDEMNVVVVVIGGDAGGDAGGVRVVVGGALALA
jgi:hypothetical protein